MKNETPIERFETLFYNTASPTINSKSWVIEARELRDLISTAKDIEKERIKKVALVFMAIGIKYQGDYSHIDFNEELDKL